MVQLDAGSKAASARFKNGDTIVGIDATESRNLNDLHRAVESAASQNSCTVFRVYEHYKIRVKP